METRCGSRDSRRGAGSRGSGSSGCVWDRSSAATGTWAIAASTVGLATRPLCDTDEGPSTSATDPGPGHLLRHSSSGLSSQASIGRGGGGGDGQDRGRHLASYDSGSSRLGASDASALTAAPSLECCEQLPSALEEEEDAEGGEDTAMLDAVSGGGGGGGGRTTEFWRTPGPPPQAAEPGHSARSRLLLARVSVYTHGCSPDALAVANQLVARIAQPGGVAFLPVPTDSLEFQMGVAWQFPSFAVALGRSYFQRLLRALPNLGRAAARCPALADLSGDGAGGGGPGDSGSQEQGLWGAAWSEDPDQAYLLECNLRSAQAACMFLATKVADQVHAYGLLRFMLSALTGQRRAVSLEDAAEVEMRCLEGLGWRLGPHFENSEAGGARAEGFGGTGTDEDLTSLFVWGGGARGVEEGGGGGFGGWA